MDIDSSASASFRLGGSANNYLQWNGGTFTIDGNLVARSGEFRGNVQVISGGSLYSGTVSGGSLVGAGYILNSSGLTFNSASVNGITTINATNGLFTTTSANIGKWNVNSSQITKTTSSGTLSLDSDTSQIIVTGYASTSAGIAAPTSGASTDIVFWAGGSRNTSAPFYVRADGFVKATSAEISGTITASSLETDNLDISSAGAITTTTGKFGVTSGGVLTATDGNFSGSITGSTITGGRIRTAESGDRIELNDPSYLNEMVLYAGSTFPGRISGFTSGSNGQLRIRSPYASGSSVAQLDLYSLGANTFFDITSTIVNAGSSLTSPIIYTGLGTDDETNTNAGVYINSSGKFVARRSGFAPIFSHKTDGSGRVFSAFIAGSAAGGITATAGGTPQFQSASDYRLKENIIDYVNATDRIKAARLRKFNLKSIPGKEFIGFIAHEFAEVDPEFVTGEKDAIDENGNPIYQEIGTTNIIYYLTGALKESILRIEELEQRLDALEG